jgi:hypothetical protein
MRTAKLGDAFLFDVVVETATRRTLGLPVRARAHHGEPADGEK